MLWFFILAVLHVSVINNTSFRLLPSIFHAMLIEFSDCYLPRSLWFIVISGRNSTCRDLLQIRNLSHLHTWTTLLYPASSRTYGNIGPSITFPLEQDVCTRTIQKAVTFCMDIHGLQRILLSIWWPLDISIYCHYQAKRSHNWHIVIIRSLLNL